MPRVSESFGAFFSGISDFHSAVDVDVPGSGEAIPLVGLSAPVLLGIFFLMFMRGDIIPRKTHQETIDERNYWREAHKISEEARATSLKQVDTLIEGFATVESMAQAIRSLAEEK